jgi:nucleoside-diphosphate-sugar epimerase
MTSSAAPRTIVVVGTSGNQGSGVVRALLSFKATGDKLWLVRGITRDPNSEKARKFLADHQTTGNRLTLVAGNVYDQASLQDAFADAYGVFAIMSEYYPGRLLMNREDMQHEVEAGYNIVLAAEKCGIEHFVFSSLPDMVKTTGGRFPNIHHMNNKHAIEKFARERLNTLTFLIPGSCSYGIIASKCNLVRVILAINSSFRVLLYQPDAATVLSTQR